VFESRRRTARSSARARVAAVGRERVAGRRVARAAWESRLRPDAFLFPSAPRLLSGVV
jgi:hypothetical protein